MDRLPGTSLGNTTRALLDDEKFQEALYACRADVTQYTIWHKSHTEPAIRLGKPEIGSLLEIDIRALAETVDLLLWCHIKTELMAEFPAVLERLRENIGDVRWQRKIVYFHAIHALWPDWEENAGRRELSKLGSLADDEDIETLQLYLDLFDDNLTFSEKQDLIDRILALSVSLSDRLHYKGSKAVLYLTIGDQRRADVELSEIIDTVRPQFSERGLSEYEQYRLAMALSLLGTLRRDPTLLAEAVAIFEKLLDEQELTPSGRANLLALIGETYRYKSDWEKARNAYTEAFAIDTSAIHKVFLCECFLHLHQLEEARKSLAEVTPDNLSGPQQVDYAFTLAALAIEIGERELLERARASLRSVSVQQPYFRERRDSFLLNVQEALASGASQTLVRRTRRLFADMARSANSYLILKPSIMGIGIDVGKIFEDLLKRGETHAKQQNKSESGPAKRPKQR